MQGSALFVAGVAGAGCSSLTPAGLLPRLDADRRSPQAVTRGRHPGEPRISRCISYSQRTKTRERDDAFQDPLHCRPAPVPPPRFPHLSRGLPGEGLGGRAPPRAALSLRAALKHEICPQPQPRPVCRHRPPAAPIGCASAAAAAPRRAGRAGARAAIGGAGGRAAPGGRSAAAAGDGRGGDERRRLQVTPAGRQ